MNATDGFFGDAGSSGKAGKAGKAGSADSADTAGVTPLMALDGEAGVTFTAVNRAGDGSAMAALGIVADDAGSAGNVGIADFASGEAGRAGIVAFAAGGDDFIGDAGVGLDLEDSAVVGDCARVGECDRGGAFTPHKSSTDNMEMRVRAGWVDMAPANC